MTSRDDMVFAPRFKPEPRAASPAITKREKQLAEKSRKIKAIGKVVRDRAALRTMRGRKIRRTPKASRPAGIARGLMTRAAGVAAGGVAVALAVATAIAARLGFDQSFESMGRAVSDALIGQIGNKSKAANEIIGEFAGNRGMALIAQRGTADEQIKTLFRDETRARARDMKGESVLMLELSKDVNATSDMWILLLKQQFEETFKEKGGVTAMDELLHKMHAAQVIFSGGGAR